MEGVERKPTAERKLKFKNYCPCRIPEIHRVFTVTVVASI
jgi:hypothetical protein